RRLWGWIGPPISAMPAPEWAVRSRYKATWTPPFYTPRLSAFVPKSIRSLPPTVQGPAMFSTWVMVLPPRLTLPTLALSSMRSTNSPGDSISKFFATLQAHFATFNLPPLVWRPYLDLHSAPHPKLSGRSGCLSGKKVQVLQPARGCHNPVQDN